MPAASRSSQRRPRIARPRRLLERLSDERLGAAFSRGEDQAFAVLYERHAPGLLAFSRQLLGSVHEAEDAVQHTMLAASSELVGGAADLHLRPWLYVVARNRCLSILRARREVPLERAPEPLTAGLSEQVQQSAELQAVLADLVRLPEDQRTALVLAELGDLSHAEIAEVLGCERDRVKALVFQAREALMTMRHARDADCATVREQLANLTGGALRRRELQAHLRTCEGCREYRSEVRRQRAAMALVLPVVPSDALRDAVLGSIGLGGGGTLAAFGAAGGGGATLATKAAATLAATGALVGGAVVATPDDEPRKAPREAATEQRTKPERTSAQPGVAAIEKDRSAARGEHDKPQRGERARQSQRRGNPPDRARGRSRSAAGTAGPATGPPASAPPAAAPAAAGDATKGNSGNNAGKGATASSGNARSGTVSKGAQGALRSNPRSQGGGATQPKPDRGAASEAPSSREKPVHGDRPSASSEKGKPDTPPGQTRKEERSD